MIEKIISFRCFWVVFFFLFFFLQSTTELKISKQYVRHFYGADMQCLGNQYQYFYLLVYFPLNMKASN